MSSPLDDTASGTHVGVEAYQLNNTQRQNSSHELLEKREFSNKSSSWSAKHTSYRGSEQVIYFGPPDYEHTHFGRDCSRVNICHKDAVGSALLAVVAGLADPSEKVALLKRGCWLEISGVKNSVVCWFGDTVQPVSNGRRTSFHKCLVHRFLADRFWVSYPN